MGEKEQSAEGREAAATAVAEREAAETAVAETVETKEAVEAARDLARYCPACPGLECATPLHQLDAAALLGADGWQRTQQLMSQATVRAAAQPAPPSPGRQPRRHWLRWHGLGCS